MSRVLLFNKPFGVICQFTREGTHRTLKDFIPVPAVYPAGRLDTDSEGLMVLTDDGRLQTAIADPRHKLAKAYWVQVEGVAGEEALARLRGGVELNDGRTLPAGARAIDPPAALWQRDPPIRARPRDSDGVDRARAARGPQSPGAPHDRGRGPADVTPGALQDRPLEPRRARAGHLARRAAAHGRIAARGLGNARRIP